MDRVPLLAGTEGSHAGQRYPITADGLVLGRDSTCSVPLQGDGISREHARIFLYNASVWVQDSGSRNGVFVNDKRLTRPKSISPGDVVRLGEHRFTLELAEADEVTGSGLPRVSGAFPTTPTLDQNSGLSIPLNPATAPGDEPAGNSQLLVVLAGLVAVACLAAAAALLL